MILHRAYSLAHAIRDQLAPFCERIEVAGSVRRARENPNDIDLVAIPLPNAFQAFHERVFQRTERVQSGAQILTCRLLNPEKTKVDIFIAHGGSADMFASEPSNWGSVLLCRTGSKEHNINIADRARQMGFRWETGRGIVDGAGKVLASTTEEEIFAFLGMDYVPPALREISERECNHYTNTE